MAATDRPDDTLRDDADFPVYHLSVVRKPMKSS